MVAHSVRRRSASCLERLELLGQVGVVGRVGRQRSGRGPQRVGAHRDADLAHRDAHARAPGRTRPTCRWSLRCLPTSGASSRHGTPTASSSCFGPDARQQQDVRRTDRAGAEHDLLGRRATTAVSPSAVRYSTPVARSWPGSPSRSTRGDLRAADHLEVRPLLDVALEERVVRARPLAVAGRGLQERHDAVGAAAVAAVVVAARDAGRDRGVDELLRAGEHRRAHRHPERAVGVVRVGVDDDVAARGQALALLEVGQHVVVAPTGRRRRPPTRRSRRDGRARTPCS